MPALPETSAHNSAPPNPGSRLDRESWLDVLAALEHLSEKQRIAVTLRYLEDLPFAEVAEATGWPENTCKTLVRRGIARLSALLAVGLDGREVS